MYTLFRFHVLSDRREAIYTNTNSLFGSSMGSNYIYTHNILRRQRQQRDAFLGKIRLTLLLFFFFTLDRLHPIIAWYNNIFRRATGLPSTPRINSWILVKLEILIRKRSNKNEQTREWNVVEMMMKKNKHAQNQSYFIFFSIIISLPFDIQFSVQRVWECITMEWPNSIISFSFQRTNRSNRINMPLNAFFLVFKQFGRI